jgi:mannose-1-phosphate guanylyltransferase/mannose-6-phosphate isomerase
LANGGARRAFDAAKLIHPVLLCGRSAGTLLHGFVEPIVVCSETQSSLVLEQLLRAGTPPKAVLLEPKGRGTAPALTLAAVHAVTADDPVLLVLPSNRSIGDGDAWQGAVEHAAKLARRGALVAFGMAPTAPLTGYGYIRARADYVEAFVARPDAATAQAWFDSGECLWNCGIYALRASAWIEALGGLRPDIFRACERAYRKGKSDGAFVRVDAAAFGACPPESIDCAVMERIAGDSSTLDAMVVRLDAGYQSYLRLAMAAT